ncbi:ribosomal RNA-processing protein 9 [Tremella mesenterica]|uniref:Ribosomal RNA-processing protein 9 n=1 Tax=Tremella mesenterica TaxID=5217 RepID=A0A4Q1BMV4_TREME|nr:ribosomal RNA-processing protein 9 [Tremella mesenterica]
MPDPFFQSDKKRKRTPRPNSTSRPGGNTKSRAKTAPRRQRPSSDSSESDGGDFDLDTVDFRKGRDDDAISDEGYIDENETAAEKRVRLAKNYLSKVRTELEADDDAFDAAEIDREIIASRLQKDVAETQGRIHMFLSDQLGEPSSKFITTPCHVPTSVAFNSKSLYISTKRGSIIPITLSTLKRTKSCGRSKSDGPQNQGHKGEILCLATSEDGKYLVSGGRDKTIGVWDVTGDEPIWKIGMRGHKDAVTVSLIRNPSYEILSASLSRHLALHSLSTLSLIDTFFGHQDSIPSVSAIKPTAAVTAGSRDRTCRWWKVEEEVQLVLRGGGRSTLFPESKDEDVNVVEIDGEIKQTKERKGKGVEFVEGSVDVVCMIDDQNFVSGGDSGAICLWNISKKKPIYTHHLSHGTDNLLSEGGNMSSPRWITSLAHLRSTDVFVSGSWDGYIRFWALSSSLRSFSLIKEIQIKGFINSLQISFLPSGSINPTSLNSHTSHSSMISQTTTQVFDVPTGNPTTNTHTNTQGGKEGHIPHTPGNPQREKEAMGESDNLNPSPPITAGRVELGMMNPVEKEKKQMKEKEIVLVAAISQEPRLGRWIRLKDVKNGALVVMLPLI